jgi:hypothetical protein
MDHFLQLLRTKTFWVGLSSIASGVALICAGQVPEGIPLIVAGLGMICIRDAIATTGTSPKPEK